MMKRLAVVVAAAALATAIAAALIEIGVRWRWDHTRGAPGFYVSDPVLGQRLAPGYEGWFAGVPVRINNLGFRDPRDYTVEKPAGVFRIVVLGDSVTFGHGTLDTTAYPYLLEQRLKEWRPDIQWQVWNLGVPGYNTRQELAYLERVGPIYRPDLVIVGFYPNDFEGNEPIQDPGAGRTIASRMMGFMQRNLYSFDFYKRVFLTLRWRLLTNEGDRQRLEHLSSEQALLAEGDVSQRPEQRLTQPDRLSDADVSQFTCVRGPAPKGDVRPRLRNGSLAHWLDAVQLLQTWHRSGRYHVVFFINMAPGVCVEEDRFYDNGILDDDDALLEVLGDETPAVSSTRPFLHYRPSQMPAASGHAVGNANAVKADVLFRYLRDRVLPARVPALIAQ
jgi:hypothetical protein